MTTISKTNKPATLTLISSLRRLSRSLRDFGASTVGSTPDIISDDTERVNDVDKKRVAASMFSDYDHVNFSD